MHVAYAANDYGYTVQVFDGSEILDEYNAGNSPHDSTAVDHEAPLTLATLRRMARRTARDIAAERGIVSIEEDSDLLSV